MSFLLLATSRRRHEIALDHCQPSYSLCGAQPWIFYFTNHGKITTYRKITSRTTHGSIGLENSGSRTAKPMNSSSNIFPTSFSLLCQCLFIMLSFLIFRHVEGGLDLVWIDCWTRVCYLSDSLWPIWATGSNIHIQLGEERQCGSISRSVQVRSSAKNYK